MNAVYLRAEAVNLSCSVYDTEDLSTIRGSGLMILNLEDSVAMAIKAIVSIEASKSITCISHGASQAVFRLELPEGTDADSLAMSVESTIRQHTQLKFTTIVVSATRDVYDSARESLVAMTRFQQMKRLRISPAGLFPNQVTMSSSNQPFPWCAIDMVRPACRTPDRIRNSEKKMLGESADVRRRYGFEQKQSFYATLSGVHWAPSIRSGPKIEAAWDFHQIGEFDKAAELAAANGECHRNLGGKLALIYVDGNGFGRKQAGFCIDEKHQEKFDHAIQSRWRTAIKRILEGAWKEGRIQNALWWNSSGNVMRHRLETLLWGGDEVIWVVPAWFGLSTLKAFFDCVNDIDQKERSQMTAPSVRSQNTGKVPNIVGAQSNKPATQSKHYGKLTYSAGLVFCHAEAPIQGIIQLAKDLANECKQHLNRKNTEENQFSYAVLESFDQLGDEIQRARRVHLPYPPESIPADAMDHLFISPTRFDKLLPAMLWMQTHFPRGSVYQILRELRRPTERTGNQTRTAVSDDASFGRLFDRALRDISTTEKTIAEKEGWRSVFDLREKGVNADECRTNWLHLAELWDYVVDSNLGGGGKP